MAETSIFNLVEGILRKYDSLDLQDIGLPLDVQSESKKLRGSLSTIETVLLDAEEKSEKYGEVRDGLLKLKAVVYDADDLVDQFSTEALRRQVMMQNKVFAKEVRDFFSRSKQLVFRRKMASGIKSIRKRLDEFAAEIRLDDIAADPEVVEDRGRGILPFVCESDVIGREQDKNNIITQLFMDSGDQKGVSVISIVGVGGLGKTTLAKLVLNDQRVISHFDLRIWVCVSQDFHVEKLKETILAPAVDMKHKISEIDPLRVRTVLDGKRYLLVLDDVWNEEDEWWIMLRDLLVGARGSQIWGSRILVTTRSQRVASNMGTIPFYQLPGLDKESSQSLFERIAFRGGQPQNYSDLMATGKKILMKCGGVPLAISTLGSLLNLKTDERDWLKVLNTEIWKLEDNSILTTLKLSYDRLPYHSKNCFAHCSSFPKEHTIEKKTLIQLWMAQIQPSDGIDNFEDICNQCIEDLSSMSFFQDVKKDGHGRINFFKMHNLIHDLARFVAGVKSSKSVHPVSFDPFSSLLANVRTPLLKANKSRAFFMPVNSVPEIGYFLDKVISHFKCLRVLDLHSSGIEKVPSSIGELNHLRYLDLSMNRGIRILPNSVSNLLNLQTLKLLKCENLEDLPIDMRNMISLIHFEIDSKSKLTHMPMQMGCLRSLRTLPVFVVGRVTSSPSSSLKELFDLNQLRGELYILNLENSSESDAEGAKLMDKQYLEAVELAWDQDLPRQYALTNDDISRRDNLLLKVLQPHSNLKELVIKGYAGFEFPGWMMKIGLSQPKLVNISLSNCIKCVYLPDFSQLPSLKVLTLKNLTALECFDEGSKASSSTSMSGGLFFPCLEKLSLIHMPKLVGWSRVDIGYVPPKYPYVMPLFHCLAKLTIKYCPQLVHLPLDQTLEEVELKDFRVELLKSVLMGLETKKPSERATTSSSLSSSSQTTFRYLRVICCEDLDSLPEEGLKGLVSLRSLSIVNCQSLVSLSQGMQYLTALEMLKIQWCPKLKFSDIKENMRGLGNLRSLKLSGLPNLKSLPEGLRDATALEFLCIEYCKHLKTLPEWLRVFSSLQELNISCCPNLLYLSEGMQSLTTLQKLKIEQCPELNLSQEGMKGLCRLQSLKISGVTKLASLPEGLQDATALQYLCIESCKDLKNLPEWLGVITSLREIYISCCPSLISLPEGIKRLTAQKKLNIEKCPNLSSQYQWINGKDWPKIACVQQATDGQCIKLESSC